jgi:quercetin dioxygenase-like cupin family protein
MPSEVQRIPRSEWSPLSQAGCVGVEGQLLLRLPQLSITMLRFAPGGTIHEHAAAIEIDVICLEGRGMTSVDGVEASLRAGERVRWPAGLLHRLWAEDESLTTLMIEHAHSVEAVRATLDGEE